MFKHGPKTNRLMAQTKQEIVRLIAQGKIQTALEGLVQLSGAIRDKELQQRCIVLYSQLSQLKGSLGAGTLDNKIYQMEINRITDAALQAANELPATIPSNQQQHYTNRQQSNQPPTSSVWKTWGILLTGGVGVVVVLGIFGLGMNNNGGGAPEHNYQSSNNNPESYQSLESSNSQAPAQNYTPSNTVTPTEPPRNSAEDKFAGSWNGTISANGIPLSLVNINFLENRRFISYFVDPYSGARLEADRGTWGLTNAGILRMTSNNGGYESYQVGWSHTDAFQARLVDATDATMIGMDVSFARAN